MCPPTRRPRVTAGLKWPPEIWPADIITATTSACATATANSPTSGSPDSLSVHGGSETDKDEEEGGDELDHEGSNEVRLSSLSAASQGNFRHSLCGQYSTQLLS
ncbi:hypothetical protein TIFTF001_009202 [Ficus carica]|uniref:Uncharacterized protein n=1 Tax=Ficus carica TaxID=3494 RepID=A0AA87ZPF5_FICCA|nr:hypothetical protein TIFTF001_009202 [Ficus carica]